ncbi:4-hydroxy-tetrahydrodipicolinate reductase [Arsenicitalea aurantiaca]|uniref:4-hydroxy-tetrahydrodipicolinate reductase n=1 Tax=Arsenicitalea aurantiaca TaxID=1783274 RepID=A0A433X8M2_9HYPH|nr:4-hydroxy-tetrahydrodipicolinate reductase [Arsenicitalea aurantiaca]RUT30425.1 4-hydroxy-tetrahydrodipicolinate reductase [Arsenicitalea aurantiaca]
MRIAVMGAGGRMGLANLRAVAAAPDMELVAAIDRPGAEAIGQDAYALAGLKPAGVAIGDDMAVALAQADAIIDFTAPAVSVAIARAAAERGLVHIIGTTGCSAEDDAAIAAAGKAGARIVKSGNFSLGVNVLASLVEKASAILAEFDIEIVEMHHNRKVDAPSGTALLLGEAAARGRQVPLADLRQPPYDGHTGARQPGTIGFASLRGGTVVGDHTVVLAGPAERIELTHRAEDRALFANGAIAAARWAVDRPAGLYSMADVLGL